MSTRSAAFVSVLHIWLSLVGFICTNLSNVWNWMVALEN